MKFGIRKAQIADLERILAFDPIGYTDSRRPSFIQDSIERGECSIIENNSQVVGYGILNYRFFGCGFISLIFTHPDFRHKGAATALISQLEHSCDNTKLFLTTNQSNKAMQALAEKLGYSRSGIIENLDEGDPELVYFKRLVR